MSNFVIGIIGGMGPKATVDFIQNIINSTPAKQDQDHCKILAYLNPQIPDRTAAILHNGENPISELVATAKTLENAGASLLIMPCNTAHHYFQQIQEQVGIPLINMLKETAAKICELLPDVKKVGLMATEGTIKSKIYDRSFSFYDVEVVEPESEDLFLIMEAIYAIKAGNEKRMHKKILKDIARKLIESGAEAIILGCTELPLLLKEEDCDFPVFIPQKIIAEKIVAMHESFQKKPEVLNNL